MEPGASRTIPTGSGAPGKIGTHGAWAMAVGGMIGGGAYTVAGVLFGAAGPLAWLSLLLGAGFALVTVYSYRRLTLASGREAVPLTLWSRGEHRVLATLLAWAVIAVYVLAMAVYLFTVGHYLGRALGVDDRAIALIDAVVISAAIGLNLAGAQEPARAQIALVWGGLVVLLSLAAIGLVQWSSENLARGAPAPSFTGVVTAAALSFIAFEGFEMLTYDLRELRRPRKVLRTGLPAAVIAVAAVYAVVTLGAASLVGADVLIAEQEHALAVAGEAAAGTAGLVVMTIAACAAGFAAINATLFSVARLARTGAEDGLLPAVCARQNRRGCPHWPTVLLGIGAWAVAVAVSLRTLVAIASAGFLLLFGLVNLAALVGALSGGGGRRVTRAARGSAPSAGPAPGCRCDR